MPEPLEPGDPQQMGEYWLAGRLGAGSQGVVYEAYAEDGTRVAVKVLYTDQSSGELRRLGREVRAAQRVASFCTARILEARLAGPSPFIVSEYVEGTSLGRAVREGRRFGGDDLHRLALGVATALTAVHEAGVVHRDLKPDNVLLGPDGPRVIDFGVARTVEMSLTAPGTLSGTPRYMAPEAIEMQPVGAPADVFAWGAIVLFAATGEHAFGAPGIAAVLRQVLTAHPDVSVLPPSLRGLVNAALAKDPLARPSARTIVSALTRAPAAGPRDLLAAGSAQAGLLAAGDPIDPTLSAVAEAAYTALTGREQSLVPEVLLRLVTIGEDGGVSTRAASAEELCDRTDPDERQAVETVLTAFGALLVQTGGQVELARPAVVRAWPPLRAWLDVHRDTLPVHHRIRQAAQVWDQHGRRRTDVLTGRRLEEALVWVTAGHPPALNRSERAFLDASTRAHTRAAQRRRALIAALAVLVILASGAAVSATRAQREAARQRDIAISAQLIAKSQELSGLDPALSQKLSIAAWRLHPSAEARHAMLSAAGRPRVSALAGHTGSVNSVAFSPDGRTLATAGTDYTVRLWDVATRRQLRTPLTGHTDTVKTVAFSSDGKTLATGSEDHTVRLWKISTHRQIGAPLRGPTSRVTSVAFSPDGKRLTSGSWDGTVRLWDVRTHRQIGPTLYSQTDTVESMASTTDGRTLAVPGRNLVLLWDMFTRRQLGAPITGHTNEITTAAFSPDGRTLATGGDDKTARLWDTTTHLQIGAPITGHTDTITSVTFSPDGRTLATGGDDHTVRLWDTTTHHQIGAPVTSHTSNITSVAFSPDGRTLATGSLDHTVGLWDITTRYRIDPPRTDPQDRTSISSTAFSSDSRTLAAGSGTSTAVWDVATRRRLGVLRQRSKTLMTALSPDGRTLATGDQDGQVRLWNTTTRRQTAVLTVKRKNPRADIFVRSLAFSPDGRRLASGHFGGAVFLWDTTTHRQIGRLPENLRRLGSSLTFSPDGRTLATGSGDHTVRLWNTTTRHQTAVLFGHTDTVTSAAFSPDGRTLATGSDDNTIRLWNTTTRHQIGTALTGHTDTVTSATFSPDGRTLATGSDDRTVRLWNPTTRRQIGIPLTGHTDTIRSVTFSPNGRNLLAAGDDAAVSLWKVDYLTDVLPWLCARTGGPLTPQEWTRHIPPGPTYRQTCP